MKFLIVRLGALGDIVHAIPVAAALRRAYPDAVVDWAVSARHRDIVDLVPVIDHVVAINDRRGAHDGVSLVRAVRDLRRAHYDVAIDPQGLLKSALIARLSGAVRVLGFTSRYVRERWASAFYTERFDPGGEGLFAPTETRHVVSLNLMLLEALGVSDAAVEFPLEATQSAASREAIASVGDRFALLNAGAGWPNKRWPPERLAAVADELQRRHAIRSLVLWGPGERALADAVVDRANGAAVAAPPTSIADVIVLCRRAALMVSGDTGPTHIAAAVGTPLVGIYGPTRPERNGPVARGDQTVSRSADCECHHLRHCRRSRMCLLDIEVPEVVAAIDRRLAALDHARG